MKVDICLDDDGKVVLKDSAGDILPAKYQKMVREQQSATIIDWLEEQCENWNQSIDRILNLHLETPPPTHQIKYTPLSFDFEAPVRPAPHSAGLMGKFSRKHREAVENKNEANLKAYERSLSEWKAEKAEHTKSEEQNKWLLEVGRLQSPNHMEDFLEVALSDIDWPRETAISFEISSDGSIVMLDVDLPEVEDMPTEMASVAARGFKINVKKRSDTQIRKEYMTHIHAIAFRLIGEVFVALPTVTSISFSGFSQRPVQNTGHIKDDYLLSVKVDRDVWSNLNFGNIAHIDPVASFDNFDVRRDISKTGIFKAIEPFSATA